MMFHVNARGVNIVIDKYLFAKLNYYKRSMEKMFVFCLFAFICSYSVSGQNNLKDMTDMDFNYHIISLNKSKSVYLKWNQFNDSDQVYVNNELYYGKRDLNGVLMEGVTLPFEIRIIQKENYESIINDKTFLIEDREKGIVDISPQMYLRLTDWEESGKDLFNFFKNDEKITTPEIISFYQSYLDITPAQMGSILANNSVGTITKGQFGDGYWKIISGGGPDTIGPIERDCNCKMIRTNSSAANIPNDSNPDLSCNALPRWQTPMREMTYGNYPFGANSIKFWSAGMLGAAKYGYMRLDIDNCRNTGLIRKTIGDGGLGIKFCSF